MSEPGLSAAPSGWLLRFAHLLYPGARVLDVASGRGRHVAWLKQQGAHVTAIDRDGEALAQGAADEQVEADLERGEAPLALRQFDLVLVTNYLHRPLFGQLQGWLAPAGVLIAETFCVGQEAFGRPSRADFLLNRDELLTAFPKLSIVAFEQGVMPGPPPRAVQRLVASADAGLRPLSGFTGAPPADGLRAPQIR